MDKPGFQSNLGQVPFDTFYLNLGAASLYYWNLKTGQVSTFTYTSYPHQLHYLYNTVTNPKV